MKNDHYYSADPSSASKPQEARFSWGGRTLSLTTDAGVFSKGELDSGTRILLEALPETLSGDILDLGCGWGPVGVCLGLEHPDRRITFADINSRALELAKANAARYNVPGVFLQSDGFDALEGCFDTVITNPPIRAGKQTIYRMFSDCAEHLKPGGQLYIVIRKQQGAPSALQFLASVYPQVQVIDKSGGYWVICCRKE